jgi:hypothetical protein
MNSKHSTWLITAIFSVCLLGCTENGTPEIEIDDPPTQNPSTQNPCIEDESFTPLSKPLECGIAYDVTGSKSECSVEGDSTCSWAECDGGFPATCVDNMCHCLEDSRSDAEVCADAGAACGTVQDDYGVPRECGFDDADPLTPNTGCDPTAMYSECDVGTNTCTLPVTPSGTYICTYCDSFSNVPTCEWLKGCGNDIACAQAACDVAGSSGEVGNCIYNGRYSVVGNETRILSIATAGHCKDWFADTSATIPSQCMANDGTLTGLLSDCGNDAEASYPAPSGYCPYALNGNDYGRLSYWPNTMSIPINDCNPSGGFSAAWWCWLNYGNPSPGNLDSNCIDGSTGNATECTVIGGFMSPYVCEIGTPTDTVIPGPAPYDADAGTDFDAGPDAGPTTYIF